MSVERVEAGKCYRGKDGKVRRITAVVKFNWARMLTGHGGRMRAGASDMDDVDLVDILWKPVSGYKGKKGGAILPESFAEWVECEVPDGP